MNLPNLSQFEGLGVYYGATQVESQLCKDQEVVVVGGGNSAGQAALYLSGFATRVHLSVRGAGLESTMSRYLIARIEASPNITLKAWTEVGALEGNGHLERVHCRNTKTGATEIHEVRNLFLMTGAVPNTAWLDGCLALDAKQFIRTVVDLGSEWPLRRAPFLLETSRPGIFAVGDVRAGSVKRVASAVGEGSMAVQFVHQILAG